MSLIEHARRELERAGLFDKDSDYNGAIAEAVMALVKTHSEQGHSGMSHAFTLQVFNTVADFKPLTPLTSDPSEWRDVSTMMGRPCWQNIRSSAVFSSDGGLTWKDNDAKL